MSKTQGGSLMDLSPALYSEVKFACFQTSGKDCWSKYVLNSKVRIGDPSEFVGGYHLGLQL